MSESEGQRILREIRERQASLAAKVQAARERAAADPLAARRLAPDPAVLAELCRLRLPDLEARVRRLEERCGIAASQSQ